MPLLTKHQILAAGNAAEEIVAVPEWEGEVRLLVTSASADQFEAWLAAQEDAPPTVRHRNFRARFVAMVLVDAGGAPLFSEAEIAELGRQNPAVIKRLYRRARALAGTEERELEEAEKNSAGGPSAAAGCD